jgi:hypothetical protein
MATKRGGSFGASWVASGDLGQNQYKFVNYGGNQCYQPLSGQPIIGVLQNKPQDKKGADVHGVGYSKISLATSLGAGAELCPGTAGAAVLVTSGNWCGGVLLTAGNSGDISEMLINIHKKGGY